MLTKLQKIIGLITAIAMLIGSITAIKIGPEVQKRMRDHHHIDRGHDPHGELK